MIIIGCKTKEKNDNPKYRKILINKCVMKN